MSAPSGPPDPMKPAIELYGEALLDAGQPVQAAAAFEKSLQRTPNRTGVGGRHETSHREERHAKQLSLARR